MSMKTILASLLASSSVVAAPALAGTSVEIAEKHCEVRVENGKVTKKGDCDDVEEMRFGKDDHDGPGIFKMIRRGKSAEDGHKTIWLSDSGSDVEMEFIGGTHSANNVFTSGFAHGLSGGFPGGLAFFSSDFDEAWDTNGDGDYSKEEIRAGKSAQLAKYDSNRDGSLSLNEYQEFWISKKRNQMVDAFQHLDEDGDASVTLDEFTKASSKRIEIRKHVIKQDKKTKSKNSKKSKRK